jgi:hypothetical protein
MNGGYGMLYKINYDPSMRISLVKGNSKLGKGVYAFNLLPGDDPLSTKDKGQLTNVKGTCGGCCDGCKGVCYAINDARRYHNTCIPSLGKNTIIMRNDIDKMFEQLKEECVNKNVKILRYHSSGEIESYNYLLHMVKLAVQLPNVKFYFYTKRFGFIEQYLNDYKELPNNLICNISEWKGNTKGFNLKGMNVFTYDDGTNPSLANIPHCPAVDKNGHKTGINCDQCKRCFSHNDGHITAVYSH